MNQYNFSLGGGFPLELDVFEEIQNNYQSLQVLGELAGDYTIIKGCERISPNTVSPGVVYYDGEVLPFKGGIGTENAKVIITETEVTKRFENGSTPVVLTRRQMEFGTGVDAMAWNQFRRPKSTQNLTLDQANKEEKSVVEALAERVRILEENKSNIPIGMVAIWGKTAERIPNGWAEYSPLAGRMPIGKDLFDIDFNFPGKEAGDKTFKLEVGHLPPHTHKWKHTDGRRTDLFASRDASVYTDMNQAVHEKGAVRMDQYPLENTGGGWPVKHLNPYRVVEFIEYIGN